MTEIQPLSNIGKLSRQTREQPSESRTGYCTPQKLKAQTDRFTETHEAISFSYLHTVYEGETAIGESGRKEATTSGQQDLTRNWQQPESRVNCNNLPTSVLNFCLQRVTSGF